MTTSNEMSIKMGLAAVGLSLKAQIQLLEARLKKVAPDLISMAGGNTDTIEVHGLGKVTVTAQTVDRPNGTREVIDITKVSEPLKKLLRATGAMTTEPVVIKGTAPMVKYTLNV